MGRKRPVTHSSGDDAGVKRSRVETARLIRQFHVLNKRLVQCKDPAEQQHIQADKDALGGMDSYQRASQLGQSTVRGGDTSKWLMRTLKTWQNAIDAAAKPLQLLDVGAVAPDNYARYSWIQCTPIDLHPQHVDIREQNFLKMTPPKHGFDIVSLSLVVNFCGDAHDRGRMLVHATNMMPPLNEANRLRLLFLVLPLPCVTNSRYMSHDHLVAMTKSIGLELRAHHFSHKLAYYLFELTHRPDPKTIPAWKKKVLPGHAKGARNNFVIVL